MVFTVEIHEADQRLFQAPKPNSSSRRKERAEPAKQTPAEETETWRQRSEESARQYQELLKSYTQLKASLKEEAEWHRRCTKLLNSILRNYQDLGLSLQAARASGVADPAVAALMGGIEQMLNNQLQQLHAQGLLDAIEPQPSELFAPALHESIGTVASNLAAGLIAEVDSIGYASAGRTVKKAKVFLAAPPERGT